MIFKVTLNLKFILQNPRTKDDITHNFPSMTPSIMSGLEAMYNTLNPVSSSPAFSKQFSKYGTNVNFRKFNSSATNKT